MVTIKCKGETCDKNKSVYLENAATESVWVMRNYSPKQFLCY